MNHQAPMIPDTKSGTSITSLSDALKENNEQDKKAPSRSELNDFLHAVAHPNPPDGERELPWVETSRKIIQYYNRTDAQMAGFDTANYFVFGGVKIYEEGKKTKAIARDALNVEEINFGKGKHGG